MVIFVTLGNFGRLRCAVMSTRPIPASSCSACPPSSFLPSALNKPHAVAGRRGHNMGAQLSLEWGIGLSKAKLGISRAFDSVNRRTVATRLIEEFGDSRPAEVTSLLMML